MSINLKDLNDIARILNSEGKKQEEREEAKTELSEEDAAKLKRDAEIDAIRTANDLKKEELKSKIQDREQRKEFAKKIFIFLCIYLFVVFSTVICSAVESDCMKFTLSDNVLITLLTTTTANMIGIFILVVKYLFNTKEH